LWTESFVCPAISPKSFAFKHLSRLDFAEQRAVVQECFPGFTEAFTQYNESSPRDTVAPAPAFPLAARGRSP
jgi:hypothetical protein